MKVNADSYFFRAVAGPDLVRATAALLLKITLGGGVQGNPYCYPEVRDCLQLLAEIEGHHDKFGVDLHALAGICKEQKP